MPKKMYVIQADDGMFYCGMRYWDKQLRKAKIYHSLSFAEDVVKAYDERNCKIIEVSLAIVSEPKTNADRIRAMNDEKLALFVRAIISAESCPCIDCDCDECFFKEPCSNGLKWYGKETEWLKQPFEGE